MEFELKFAPETFSTVESAVLSTEDFHEYYFQASAGQVISIALTAKDDNARLGLLYEEENGEWLYVDNSRGIAADKRVWQGALPFSEHGRYLLEITNNFSGQEAEYDLFVGISAVAVGEDEPQRLVTPTCVDRMELGMSLFEALEVSPGTSTALGADGEGSLALEVLDGKNFLMSLYMDTECIGAESRVQAIEAWGRHFMTKEGVFPTMSLHEAAKIYGGLQRIDYSERESREFALFNEHPEKIKIEVFGGDFSSGSTSTRETYPDAQVVALWVGQCCQRHV
ncbi:MAG: hypothetical protein ACWA5U_08145 [bacterium]